MRRPALHVALSARDLPRRASPPQTTCRADVARNSNLPTLVSANLYLGDRLPSALELRAETAPSLPADLLLSALVLRPFVSASPATSSPFGPSQRHALLFAALRHAACDVRLSPCDSARASPAGAVLAECVQSLLHGAWALAVPDRRTEAPLLAGHMRLAEALVCAAQHPERSDEAEHLLRRALETTPAIPEGVLTSLLSLPTSPELLHVLLTHVLERSTGGCVDAALFQVLLSALLNNDNWFAPAGPSVSGLVRMDRVLRDTVLRGVALQAQTVGGFDYISVRWTPLLNKWARIYTKQAEGELLYADFHILLEAVPAAEAKIPASFYVRLIGALIDRGNLLIESGGADDPAHAGELLWAKVVTTARRAVRLFGRHPPELRSVWIVLMKAALTLPSRHTQGTRRLLEAYLLCTEQDHPAPIDRAATMQLMRLTSESILTRWSSETGPDDADAALETCAAHWIRPLCDFMRAYSTVSFLWLLDGIGMVVSALWAAHGSRARPLAAMVCDTLTLFLQQNGVTGISLSNNPALAAALDKFQLGEHTAFWWQCGCGARLASASRRCVECLRSSGGGVWWTCPSCGERQGTTSAAHGARAGDDGAGCCRCDSLHPRLKAAIAHGYRVCTRCGELTDTDGHCHRCHELVSRQEMSVPCTTCGTTHTANALYCPQCFRPNPTKSLRIWLCETCEHFNLSTWSHCQSCTGGSGSRRRTNALTAEFVPWVCGCGASNHPCRTACRQCSAGDSQGGYTCPACHTRSPLQQRESLLIGATSAPVEAEDESTTSGGGGEQRALPLHLCAHCNHIHPRDALVLSTSPTFPRHCTLCAAPVAADAIDPDTGCFVHCQTVQSVDELQPFRCACARPTAPTHPLQIGYDCQFCGLPRPALGAGASVPSFYVWRCLRETGEDFHLCGAWNYSWRRACHACHRGRVMATAGECRARAESWECPLCRHQNRPTDVLLCGRCGTGLHQIAPCLACGSPHLTFACH